MTQKTLFVAALIAAGLAWPGQSQPVPRVENYVTVALTADSQASRTVTQRGDTETVQYTTRRVRLSSTDLVAAIAKGLGTNFGRGALLVTLSNDLFMVKDGTTLTDVSRFFRRGQSAPILFHGSTTTNRTTLRNSGGGTTSSYAWIQFDNAGFPASEADSTVAPTNRLVLNLYGVASNRQRYTYLSATDPGSVLETITMQVAGTGLQGTNAVVVTGTYNEVGRVVRR